MLTSLMLTPNTGKVEGNVCHVHRKQCGSTCLQVSCLHLSDLLDLIISYLGQPQSLGSSVRQARFESKSNH